MPLNGELAISAQCLFGENDTVFADSQSVRLYLKNSLRLEGGQDPVEIELSFH